MLFSIAVCAQDPCLRAGLQRHCQDYFARRADSCLVEPMDSPRALLDRDAQNARYHLYLIELAGQPGGTLPEGLEAAMELRRRGRRTPLAFLARTPAWPTTPTGPTPSSISSARPGMNPSPPCWTGRWNREYGPALTLPTAAGLRVLPSGRSNM